MFELVKKIFIGLLISLVNRTNHAKCHLLSKKKCMTQFTLINQIIQPRISLLSICG